MEISQIGLLLLLWYSAAAGVSLGALYDAFRVLRRLVLSEEPTGKIDYKSIKLPFINKSAYPEKKKKLAAAWYQTGTVVFDILFALACGITLILLAYSRNSGKMRWMIFVGTASGFAAYYFTLGKMVKNLIDAVVFLIRAVILYGYSLAALPIRIIKKRRKKWQTKKEQINTPLQGS